MSQSKNWKAYYSGDFTQYDLTVRGEVRAQKILDVMPGLKEADSPPLNSSYFHLDLFNTGDGDYKEVKQKFKVQDGNVTTVIIFNEGGGQEAEIPVTQMDDPDNSSFSGDFSDEFK